MKKFFTILVLMVILGVAVPAFAAPPPGPGGHPGGGHRIHAGAYHAHRIPPPPRHHRTFTYVQNYVGGPWGTYQLGLCNPCYPCRPMSGVYFPVGGAGVSIRF